MMSAIYKILTFFLSPMYYFGSYIFPEIRDFRNKRKASLNGLEGVKKNRDKVCIWFHGASVGELDQCKSIANVIKQEIPDAFIIQSVFSSSVSEKNLHAPPIDFGFFLPPDIPGSYDKIFLEFSPKVLVISAWDIWPNLISSAKEYGCKVYLACGSLHEGSGRIRNPFMRKLTKEVLQKFSGISPSGKSREYLFKKYAPGIAVHTCGDSRFDSVCEKIESKISKHNLNLEFHKDEKIFIFASTYSICEKLFFPKIQDILSLGYKIWIFPHKISPGRLDEIQASLNKNSIENCFYSSGVSKSVVVFDVLGLLAYAFERAKICYVGGGFTHRIHNVIEPAYFGIPISSGGKIYHSPEAMDLKEQGYLTILKEGSDFLEFTNKYEDNELYEKQKQEIKSFVNSNRGASRKFFETFLRTELG